MRQKILYLITKSNFGGAQRYVHDLAVSLPKDEFEVLVAVGGQGPLSDKLIAASIKVHTLSSLQRDLSLRKEIRAAIDLWKVIRLERPSILHINSSKAGVIGAIVGRLARVPKIIFTAHGWAFNEARPLWQRLVFKKAHWLTVLLSHKTIAVSKQVKEQMDWPLPEGKITVINNGRSVSNIKSRDVARDYLAQVAPKLQKFKNDFWSITIAELHPIKRHEAVIDTIKRLVDQNENIRHLIIGEGEQMQALERQIERLNLQNNVFLLGQVDDASSNLKAADLFILASRSEGMPYVLIEALIAELPIIATEVGGIPEVIEAGVSGLLTPPLDNQALFEAILRVLKNPDLRQRLSVGATERAKEFSLEKTIKETILCYKSTQ